MSRDSAKKLFTPQLVERLRPEKGRRVELMDSNCPGLVLRVTENGVRTFGVLYRVAGRGGQGERGKPLFGKQQRITLGKFPRVGLKEAREKARAIIDEATEGRDPKEAEVKARAARSGTMIEDVVTQFVEPSAIEFTKDPLPDTPTGWKKWPVKNKRHLRGTKITG